ncbi:2Fe-2S iron-sulfur cluster-binding protein [Paraglaciecola chathamensis]|uniref:Ferredoxin n=1 Tax=Paraglaciecola agarilytica NO2 TaxID=1125747 RepID=A0ABQ0IA11_9ALTE|nr:2Fe-2S iron-sulfur cluster-binding protein [Paraglaciecola agarilytica]GAC06219.1 ferredoxin [Paraglaciecola agarilytica NO2]
MKYKILVKDTNESFLCDEEKSILESMAKLGRKGIPLGCRGGGCGVCKVEVISGKFSIKPMSSAHITDADLQCNRVLACRISPESDMGVKVIGKMKMVFPAYEK